MVTASVSTGRRNVLPSKLRHSGTALPFKNVRLADERRDETGPRPGIDFLRVALLDELARLHHRDAVGERERLALIVRDEDERAADLCDGCAEAPPASHGAV